MHPPPTQMQTLWIFNHYAITPAQGGGTRHFDMAEALMTHGYTTTIFASARGYLNNRGPIIPVSSTHVRQRLTRATEFVWLRTPAYEGNGWRRGVNMVGYFASALIAQSRLTKPDAIIGSSPHPLAGMAALVTARLRSVPFILECRDFWPADLIELGVLHPTSLTARVLGTLERFILRGASRVVVLQDSARAHVIERGISPSRVCVIPNGVITEDVTTPPLSPNSHRVLARLREWRQADKYVIVYAGAHGPANGLETALEAASLVRDTTRIHFLFIGSGPEKRRLLKMRADLRLANVTFADPLPKQDIPAVLKLGRAGLVCLAQSSSGSVNKLLDYFAAGLPVIFAGRSSYDPVSSEGLGVSVAPGSAMGIADAARYLAGLPEDQAAAIGRRAQRYVAASHELSSLARRLAVLVRAVQSSR